MCHYGQQSTPMNPLGAAFLLKKFRGESVSHFNTLVIVPTLIHNDKSYSPNIRRVTKKLQQFENKMELKQTMRKTKRVVQNYIQ